MASAVDGEILGATVATFMEWHDARNWDAMRSMLTDDFVPSIIARQGAARVSQLTPT